VSNVISVDEAGSDRSISITVRGRASTKMTLRYGGKAISRKREHVKQRSRTSAASIRSIAKPETPTRRKLNDRRLERCSARLTPSTKIRWIVAAGLLDPRLVLRGETDADHDQTPSSSINDKASISVRMTPSAWPRSITRRRGRQPCA